MSPRAATRTHNTEITLKYACRPAQQVEPTMARVAPNAPCPTFAYSLTLRPARLAPAATRTPERLAPFWWIRKKNTQVAPPQRLAPYPLTLRPARLAPVATRTPQRLAPHFLRNKLKKWAAIPIFVKILYSWIMNHDELNWYSKRKIKY